jgi:hypothetical protein
LLVFGGSVWVCGRFEGYLEFLFDICGLLQSAVPGVELSGCCRTLCCGALQAFQTSSFCKVLSLYRSDVTETLKCRCSVVVQNSDGGAFREDI